MSTDLYRLSKSSYAVKSQDGEVTGFATIEKACDFLESLGIPDGEIDYALSDMGATGHTHAQFGVLEGRFIFSDNNKPSEMVGVA